MKMRVAILLFWSGAIWAQTANLNGVWKADLQRSQMPGPPMKDYVEIFEQNGVKVTEQVGAIGGRGEQRSQLTYSMDGQPTITTYQGVPSRETVTPDGAGFVLTVETSGKPDTTKRSYQLSPDGQTLTISWEMKMGPQVRQSTVVLTKAPAEAGDWLRKPEELASAHFKNVKTDLKDLPASEFINRMRYFAWALNKDCEFCHVQSHFDSDDKEEKRTGRRMIGLVANTNQKYFDNKQEVNCFTCHEFHDHPQARPLFSGEPEHHHGEGEHEHPAEHETHPSQ
jgi:hypothetical protein